MSPGVGLLLPRDPPCVWGARDFARDFGRDFGRGAGVSSGISTDCIAWPPLLGGLKYSLFMSGYIDSIVGSPYIFIPVPTTSRVKLFIAETAPQPNFAAPTATLPIT